MGVTPIFQKTAPPLSKAIYRQPTLTAVYCIQLPITAYNPYYLAPAYYLIKVPDGAEALTNNRPQEPIPAYYQKTHLGDKSLFGTAMPQDLIKCT